MYTTRNYIVLGKHVIRSNPSEGQTDRSGKDVRDRYTERGKDVRDRQTERGKDGEGHIERGKDMRDKQIERGKM